MSRDSLIEAEAKRRCIAGGYTLETPARALLPLGDREGPLWQAFVPRIEAEIERLELAGFVVMAPGDFECAEEAGWAFAIPVLMVVAVVILGLFGWWQ